VREPDQELQASSVAPTGHDRRIWLCADDYGISPAVNVAIRDLIAKRRLNATSVMVVAPSFSRSEAASLSTLNAEKRLAQIGLHVTLTGPFRPLSAGFEPTRQGSFLPLPEMMRRSLLRQLNKAALVHEVAAQVRAFASAFGRAPDFLDGHHHVHIWPQVRDVVLAAVKEVTPTPWLRQCVQAGPLRRRLYDRKGLAIDVLSRTLRRRARASGIAINPAFAGTYEFVASADFAALFPTFLNGLPDGGLIGCHPGHVDAELRRLDPLTELREHEYRYLRSDAFPAMLAAHGVGLAAA
jgi:predicted glycoside hydrolase/deacetylase ChbG (UPF0249 family)